MQSNLALTLSDLSDAEVAALHDYKAAHDANGRSKCFDMNRDLRNGLRVDELPAETRPTAEALDSIFARAPQLTEEITLFRAVGTRAHLPLHDIGRDFRNLEFWSASRSEGALESFLNPVTTGGHGAILELQLPEGFPVYDMETLEGFGGFERELLLPRGVRWTVMDFALVPEGDQPPLVRGRFANIVRAALKPRSWD